PLPQAAFPTRRSSDLEARRKDGAIRFGKWHRTPQRVHPVPQTSQVNRSVVGRDAQSKVSGCTAPLAPETMEKANAQADMQRGLRSEEHTSELQSRSDL